MEYKKACISTKFKITIKWFNFFPKFLNDTTSRSFKQQTKALKGLWNDIIKVLMKEFSMKNVYQNIIFELSQLKQGALEFVKKYKEKTITLQNNLKGVSKHKAMKELI